MSDQFVSGAVYQGSSVACIIDLVPPTGGLITSLSNNVDGSLQASWSPASDISLPIRFQVFLQESTSVGLFNSVNQVYEGPGSTFAIYRDANNVPIVAGKTYACGVRAVDAVGNVNTNTTSLSIVAVGIDFDTLIALIASGGASAAEIVGQVQDGSEVSGVLYDNSSSVTGIVEG